MLIFCTPNEIIFINISKTTGGLICVIWKHVYQAVIFHILLLVYPSCAYVHSMMFWRCLCCVHICIFIARGLCMSDILSSVQDGQDMLADELLWWFEEVFHPESHCAVNSAIVMWRMWRMKRCSVRGLYHVLLHSGGFKGFSAHPVHFARTNCTQVAAQSSCDLQNCIKDFFVQFVFLNFPQNVLRTTTSITAVSLSLQDLVEGLFFFFFSLSILILISHIYGICLMVIIILSSRLKSLSQRDVRGRRAGDDAAERQPSYRGALSFQRLECVRVTTKTKRSSSLPAACRLFLPSSLEHTAPFGNWVATFSPSLPLCIYSICLYLSGTIRRLIRLSWLFLDVLCWWCSSTGEAGGWQPLEHGGTLICRADLQNCTPSFLSRGEGVECERKRAVRWCFSQRVSMWKMWLLVLQVFVDENVLENQIIVVQADVQEPVSL